MFPTSVELLNAARNVNSQFGEDGIIDRIFQKIPNLNRWCVEFGAWDGKHLSNTRRLIDEEQYSAVLIEADQSKFATLQETFQDSPCVDCICASVGFEINDNLDVVLKTTSCPIDFDFLSIDIDGNDVHAWSATTTYRPKVVCIEFNPTIPSCVNFCQPPEADTKWGAGLAALYGIGANKGYRLVCANEVNAFFVAKELWFGDYAKDELDIGRVRKEEPEARYIFSGYDGAVLTSGPLSLTWHGVKFDQSRIQVLPKMLRKYPDDYKFLQRALFSLGRRVGWF